MAVEIHTGAATSENPHLNKSDQQALEGFKGKSQKPISEAKVEKLLQVLADTPNGCCSWLI